MNRKSKLLLSLPLMSVPFVAGCPEPAGANVQEIIAAVPLTGEFAARGEQHLGGIQMAGEALVAAGAFGDGELVITPVNAGNDKAEVTTALEAYIAAADEEGRELAGVISSTGKGHEGSLKTALRNKIPHFEMSSGSDDEEFLTGDDRNAPTDVSYAFSTRPLCYTEAQITAEYLQREHAGETLALLRGNQAHDVMHTNVIRSELEYYATVLGVADPVNAIDGSETDYLLDYNVNQFEAELTSLVTDHNPDVIFYHLRGDASNLRMLQDSDRAGFTGKIITCGMSRTADLLDNSRINNYLDYFADRVHFIMRTPVPSEDLTTWKDTFAKKNEAKGIKSDTWAPAAHDAMMLIGLGLATTGGTREETLRDAIETVASNGGRFGDGPNHRLAMDAAAGTEDVSAMVTAAQAGDIDYDGPSGTMNWTVDDQGNLVKGELGDKKHFVPGAYYVEVIRNDEDGDGIGAYEKLTDWDPYATGDQYWRTEYVQENVSFD